MHLREDALPEETLKLAKKIAKKSPIALKKAIETLQYAKPASFYEGIEAEAACFWYCVHDRRC